MCASVARGAGSDVGPGKEGSNGPARRPRRRAQREEKKDYESFINSTLVPAIRSFPGCRFVYVANCIEKGHEGEVIYVSGWDSHDNCEALEATDLYRGAAKTVTTFYTKEYSGGAVHLHYEAFAERP